MSIHLKDTVITFRWWLEPTDTPLVKADFDVLLQLPDGTETYTDDGITTYVAPTATAQGKVTFNHTVTTLGRYRATLTVGGSTSYTQQAVREIYVVNPPAGVLSAGTVETYRGPVELPTPAP